MTQDAAIRFDVQAYGEGGGVMAAYRVDGESAEAVAQSEAERLRGSQVATIGVWAYDRKSGTAQAKVPR